jgi:hypothetical protein
VGKKRLRGEALLAATALPSPPPAPAGSAPALAPAGVADVAAWRPALLPDPSLVDRLPADDAVMARLLAVLPQADVYLQDEVQLALHPTLTRVWCRQGRRGQRLVQAPGGTAKRWGFGLVDWRDGWVDWAVDPRRAAAPLCAQVRRAVERSAARGRVALVILDNLGIHTARGSRLVRALLDELKDHLLLVSTPASDPEANRIEGLWRALRRDVPHNHQRRTLDELLTDATGWVEALTPARCSSTSAAPLPTTSLLPRRHMMLHDLPGSI